MYYDENNRKQIRFKQNTTCTTMRTNRNRTEQI